MNLDGHDIGEIETLCRLALNHALEHRHFAQQRPDVAQNCARLPSINRNHHQRSALAGRKILAIVTEHGEINGA